MQTVIGGDGVSLSIAAASVVAKVTRDRMMAELALEHPVYGFERHVGCGNLRWSNMAGFNAGALDNPLIRCVDELL